MSAHRRRVASVGLAAIGAAISGYLTWVHYSGSLALCVGAGGCETVQASRYAMLGPVPVAVLGLIALGTMTALATWRLREDAPAWTLAALFGLSLAGTLFVTYLTYLELFVIHAILPVVCQRCHRDRRHLAPYRGGAARLLTAGAPVPMRRRSGGGSGRAPLTLGVCFTQ